MGGSGSKSEKTDALRLCKARKRFIKQAIDSRYAFAAAHVSYVESLRNIGIALRRFAEAEVLVEPSANETDKTPSHSSIPSPSPSHIAEVSDSPLPNGSPLSPPVSRLSYMRSGGTSSVTVRVNPASNSYFHDGESYTMPPPPPPPPEPGHSWDYFDPIDDAESFRFMRDNDMHVDFDDMGLDAQCNGRETELDHSAHEKGKVSKLDQQGDKDPSNSVAQAGAGIELNMSMVKAEAEPSISKKDKSVLKKDLSAEREDPSEFITHRAKDFLSSIKDIENRFFRASESGKEVSRMLEVSTIRVGYSDAKEGSSTSDLLAALHLVCCRGNTSLVSHEPSESATKVITWKRSTSSRSSSSRNPLASASRDDNDDSGSDFAEEFCMIAGIHSSTLERLYAWERKLYDEVKASETIRKEYDRKCDQLRHQFAKDLSAHVIDKTRAVVKDLHSRIRVALQSVDSISKRIEKMRDDELQPQLIELIQGLIRMWKAMLECHHAQYITISLAYHAKSTRSSSSTVQGGGEVQREIMGQLEEEIECFGLSFANWINSHTSYVEALNGWLQNCILQPQERSKGRRAFSPRRVLAPPIIVLGRDWSAGIKDLPSEELSNAIKDFLGDLRHLVGQKADEMQQKQKASASSNNGESETKDGEENVDRPSNLTCVRTSLGKVLDRLTKFSEASLKMYEDIRQKSETARNAYSNYRIPRYQR